MKLIKIIAVLIIVGIVSVFFILKNPMLFWQFSPNGKMAITKDIYLHRTSAEVFTLNDSEGLGLVYGKVTKLSFNDNKTVLYVEYNGFKDNQTKYVSLDVESLKVQNLEEKPDVALISSAEFRL